MIPRLRHLALIALSVHAVGAHGEDVLNIGTRLEPLWDASLVASMQGTHFAAQRPVDMGSVIKFDKPWEGLFCGYATVLRVNDRFRVYYRGLPRAGGDGTAHEVTCIAESDDGIEFQKPDLTLFPWKDHRQTNIVLANAAPASHNFSPFLDTRPDCPANARFKALGGSATSGLLGYESGDGITWRKIQAEPIFRDSGWVFDSQNVAFWSPVERKYILYYRRVVDKVRAIARATSVDFREWTEPVQMQYSDTNSSVPSHHLYTNQTHPYFRAPHVYVSTAARFLPGRQVLSDEEANAIDVHPSYFKDTSDAILMTSRAGDERYLRDCSGALIRPGIGAENWVSRTNYPALNIVQTGPTEMSLYVNQNYGQPTSHLRRYAFRLDGLAAITAPYAGGEFLTKPLRFGGKKLHLNFATSAAGGIKIEILEAGNPIPGFTLAESQELIGNEISRVARWKQGSDLSSLSGKIVQLRFVMQDADLFALQTGD